MNNMSTKDKRISLEDKGRYPFTVPQGYFDDLTARIMKQIPEDTAAEDFKVVAASATEQKTRTKKLALGWNGQLWQNITSIAAAIVLVAMVAVRLISSPEAPEQTKGTEIANTTTEEYNEDLMNYAMMDNMDVYCYLSGEGAE